MRNGNKGISRREFLKAIGLGALGTPSRPAGWAVAWGAGCSRLPSGPGQAHHDTLSLVATDGYVTVPGREPATRSTSSGSST